MLVERSPTPEPTCSRLPDRRYNQPTRLYLDPVAHSGGAVS
jgi:hypothetical protein